MGFRTRDEALRTPEEQVFRPIERRRARAGNSNCKSLSGSYPAWVTLGEARIHDVVSIQHVGGEPSFRRRLMELGLVPGTQVTLLAVAPLGDPLKLRVRGCDLSIRRSEALAIEVRLCEAPEPARSEPALTESPV